MNKSSDNNINIKKVNAEKTNKKAGIKGFKIRKFDIKSINKYHILIMFIMLLCAAAMLYLTVAKEGMHLDEYLTYGLANSESEHRNKITPEYGVRLNPTEVFDVFFYADDFSIKNVWENQANNVHPPFYYLIFHIFTLVTHCFLGLKTGVILNIVFHLINIVLVWSIIKELINKEYAALLGAFIYAFTPIIMGNVLFIRMYTMMSMFVLALTLLFVRGFNKQDRKAFYIKLGLLSVFGALTHYYFLIYLFYSCIIWGIYLIVKRNYKEIAVFVGTMIAAGAACLAIFPAILEQMFQGAAGERTIKNLLSSAFFNNIKNFVSAIDKVYSGYLLTVVLAAVILTVFKCVVWKENGKKINNTATVKWLIVLVPCVLYFLTITWLAITAATRYISPIYPVCIILLIGLFEAILSCITQSDKTKCVAGIVMLAFLMNAGYKMYTWPELYTEAKEYIEEARKYGVNNECIYVMDLSWHSFMAYQEFLQYQNMVFIRDNNLDLLYTDDYADYDHVVMYFDKATGEENIEKILDKMVAMNPKLDGYEKLHEWYYNVTYYLD